MSDAELPLGAPDRPPITRTAPTDEESPTMYHPDATLDPYAEEDWLGGYEELPPRPRRRLVTPLNLALLAIVIAGAGFIGGVEVQKGQSSATTGAGLRGAFASALTRAGTGTGTGTTGASGVAGRGGFGAGAGAGGAGAAGATTGTVSTVSGNALYVSTAAGNTVKVTAAPSSTVTATTLSSISAVHPGDTVIVVGATNSDGSVTATSIRATAANAATAGGGFASLFGGGTRGGGAAATGTTSTGSGAASGGQSLFGSG
jgi:hypothetical protein